MLGGGSGIGLMITQALAVNGARVYIVGRTEEKLDTVAKKYNGNDIDGEIIPLQGNTLRNQLPMSNSSRRRQQKRRDCPDLRRDFQARKVPLHPR